MKEAFALVICEGDRDEWKQIDFASHDERANFISGEGLEVIWQDHEISSDCRRWYAYACKC